MLNALRLIDGFAEAAFESRTDLAFSTMTAVVTAAANKGLLERAATAHWRPTETGQRFLNDLQAMFLPESGGRGR